MANRSIFLKSLATAASSNNIATSQSASAGVALSLNGAATDYLSTTTTAAVAVGGTFLPLTATTGVKVGQTVTDTSATTLVSGTVVTGVGTGGVAIWPPVGGVSGVGNGDTIVFPGMATIDAVTATNTAIGRRVVLAYTGSDTSFVIVGTNATGNVITDTAVGASGAAQSNLDFVTVTSITPVGGGLTGVTAGTNGVGSSPWWFVNTYGYAPVNVGLAVELVSGSVNFTGQYTYEDPNKVDGGLNNAVAFNMPQMTAQTATIDALMSAPVFAMRVLINSGTGVIRVRLLQAGNG